MPKEIILTQGDLIRELDRTLSNLQAIYEISYTEPTEAELKKAIATANHKLYEINSICDDLQHSIANTLICGVVEEQLKIKLQQDTELVELLRTAIQAKARGIQPRKIIDIIELL